MKLKTLLIFSIVIGGSITTDTDQFDLLYNDILKNPMFEDLLLLEEKYVEDHVKERYFM